jgi:APA family basic amino acid/polyamine antiporter
MKQEHQLLRSLSLAEISFYGIGTILGAGIYVLLGEVVNESGMGTPLAFLLSAIIVSFSAYSYAQMSRRFPNSAGEAVYIMEGLHSRHLSALAGYTISLGGIVSAATIARGFTGYFAFFSALPSWVIIIALVAALTALAAWGVKQSVAMAVMTTLVEIAGLLLVLIVGSDDLNIREIPWRDFLPGTGQSLIPIVSGAFLAFFAFIGFEDMVNMAEEVENPRRNLPLGIAIALITSTLLYGAVAVVAIMSLPLSELARSEAPLALIIERNSTIPAELMAAISIIAIINGALIQIIMVSRVLYGMAGKKLAPQRLRYVHPVTRTPLVATLLTGIIVVSFALWLPISTLAKTTSSLILVVFTLVNISLLVLNCRGSDAVKINPSSVTETSHTGIMDKLIPAIGGCLCISFLAFQLWNQI